MFSFEKSLSFHSFSHALDGDQRSSQRASQVAHQIHDCEELKVPGQDVAGGRADLGMLDKGNSFLVDMDELHPPLPTTVPGAFAGTPVGVSETKGALHKKVGVEKRGLQAARDHTTNRVR